MYKLIEGELDSIIKQLNEPENRLYKLVQIVPRGTGGNVQAVLYREPEQHLETLLVDLKSNIDLETRVLPSGCFVQPVILGPEHGVEFPVVPKVPWYRRFWNWLCSRHDWPGGY